MAIAEDRKTVFQSEGCQKIPVVIMEGIFHLPTRLTDILLAIASGMNNQVTIGLNSLPVSPFGTISCHPCDNSRPLIVQLYLMSNYFLCVCVGSHVFFLCVLIRLDASVGLNMSFCGCVNYVI